MIWNMDWSKENIQKYLTEIRVYNDVAHALAKSTLKYKLEVRVHDDVVHALVQST